MLFYYYWFYINEKNKIYRSIIKYLGISSIIFSFLNPFLLQNIYIYNRYTLYVESITVIVFCLFYFFALIKEENILYPFKDYRFWINTGLFFYYTIHILYYLMWDVLIKNDKNDMLSMYLLFVLNLLQYSFILLGLFSTLKWKKIKQ